MENDKLKELIIEHKSRFLSRRGLIHRELQDTIEKYITQREIIVFAGVRRCGKSTLMSLICSDLIERKSVPPGNVLYLNFEDERFAPFSVHDFESIYELFLQIENPVGRKYLFLDEIQNIPGWERWLNRLYEFEDVKIFVTGSNASLLGSETSTALTGRNRQIIVWPFSFREFLSLRGTTHDGGNVYSREKKAEIKRHFAEYVSSGGFPEVLKTGDVSLLEDYYRDILYRDVIARHNIKNIREIKELALYLASNPATIQSYRGLMKIVGGRSINTVKNYMSALNDVYLFFFLDLFDYSVKRQIYNPSKIYSIDPALTNAISFRFSMNRGHIYENIVFLELNRRNKEVYYGRSIKGKEIDFVIKQGLSVAEVIQVCASVSAQGTLQREVQAMLDVCGEINKGIHSRHASKMHLTMITEDEENIIKTDLGDIQVVPIWKWLIQRETTS